MALTSATSVVYKLPQPKSNALGAPDIIDEASHMSGMSARSRKSLRAHERPSSNNSPSSALMRDRSNSFSE